jgi:hypothetical protein
MFSQASRPPIFFYREIISYVLYSVKPIVFIGGKLLDQAMHSGHKFHILVKTL